MSIRKQYSFPSELSLQRQEPTTRPLVSPIAPKDEPTYTTRPLDVTTRPVGDSTIVSPIEDVATTTPSGGGGFTPPSGGSGSEADESGTDTIKKADWLPILLIGAGALIFVIKPFK